MSAPKKEVDQIIELLEASIRRAELFGNLLAERYQLPRGDVYQTLTRLKDISARTEVPNV